MIFPVALNTRFSCLVSTSVCNMPASLDDLHSQYRTDGLPQEIIDEMIDNLAFDFPTLKSTSLVRKSWTHRTRRQLFNHVQINSLSHPPER